MSVGKMMTMIWRCTAVFLVLLLCSDSARAYSFGPGFCDVSATTMTSTMGAQDGSGNGGYQLTFSKSSDVLTDEVITLTLSHASQATIKGLLLVSTIDSAAAGTFSVVPSGFQVLSSAGGACSGSSTARVGHSNGDAKSLPLEFQWKSTLLSNHSATFEMMVVVDSRTSWFAHTSTEGYIVNIANPADATAAPTTTTSAPTVEAEPSWSASSSPPQSKTMPMSFWMALLTLVMWL